MAFPLAKVDHQAWLLVVGVVLLQFVLLPPLGDGNQVAKQFLFLFGTVAVALAYQLSARSLHLPRGLLPVGLLAGGAVLSAAAAFHAPTAWVGTGVLLVNVLFLLLVIQLARAVPSFFDRLVAGVLVSGVVGALLGLYQYLDYLAFGVARRMVIPWLLPPTWGIRLSGPYNQSNLFALLLALCLLAFAYVLLHGDAAAVRRPLALLRWVPVALVAFILLLTQSRAGLLSLLAVLGPLVWAWLQRRAVVSGGRRGELPKFLAVLACAFALYWLLMHGAFTQLKSSFAGPPSEAASVTSQATAGRPALTSSENRAQSDDQRLVLWTSALLMFSDHPWLGVGLDNYKFHLSRYQMAAHDLLRVVEYEALPHNALWAHNEYLQLLAEGGGGALLALAALMALFLASLRRAWRRQEADSPAEFFNHLFLLPFLLQSMFEWPLRYPPLCALFLAFAGILLARGRGLEIEWRPWQRRLTALLLVASVILGGWLFSIDWLIGRLRDNLLRTRNVKVNIELFHRLAYNPYSQYRTMNDGLPGLIRLVLKTEEVETARQLVPPAESLVHLSDGYWQWYNLALLYDMVGEEPRAYEAVNMAIERNPVFEPAWAYLHHLNIRRAAVKTGRTVESFYPPKLSAPTTIRGFNHD